MQSVHAETCSEEMLHASILLLAWSSRLRPPASQGRPRARAACSLALPPALNNADGYARGALGKGAWWRQDTTSVQLIVALDEDTSFKRDVEVDVSRRSITLRVLGADILVGGLAHEVDAAAAEWVVDDELDLDDGERFLVVDLPKRESYVDWASPLAGEGGQRRLRIGGKGEAQKEATAQQLASYQVLQKLPSAERGDVYARAPAEAGEPSTTLYFVGKVIAEATPAALSLASQVLLVREHARLYLPAVFGEVGDDEMELWLAPGNSEMRVAQDEIGLRRWQPPDPAEEAAVALPAAGACGFEPETAPPAHLEAPPLSVQRDADGRPLGDAFKANVMRPDEVPGAYEGWLKDQ